MCFAGLLQNVSNLSESCMFLQMTCMFLVKTWMISQKLHDFCRFLEGLTHTSNHATSMFLETADTLLPIAH